MAVQRIVNRVSEAGGGRGGGWAGSSTGLAHDSLRSGRPLTVGPLSPHRGDDYKSHVKCLSEDQKYGGKGYEGKTHKGDLKQQAWIQVRSGASSSVICHLPFFFGAWETKSERVVRADWSREQRVLA